MLIILDKREEDERRFLNQKYKGTFEYLDPIFK